MKNICTMKNALNAYQKARRCKRYRPEVLEFEANREEYLGKAIRELESLTYTPGKYKVFKVWEPKERIIMALPFYDRVIQHMIVNYIEPIFEHQFIYHSYACRKGKGAHRASKQLTKVATTAVLAHGMILTSCSYVLSWIGMDPVVDVSSTIVKEIVAPLVVYLGTNTIMNIFEKNKLSFSVPINSTVISKDGTTHKASDDEAVG